MDPDAPFGPAEVARYWDGNADRWADHVRRGWDAYREAFNNPAFFAFLGDLAGLEVLDAGCGEGHNTRLLARQGAHVTGIDISPRMIELARAHEQREPLGVRYHTAAFDDLGAFEVGTFDCVVSFMALMDGPDLPRALRELHRVLRPGGRLVFSILHPCFTTPQVGWIRDEHGHEVGLRVADYFADQPFIERWKFSKGPVPTTEPDFAVPRFPRTLSLWINSLVEAGFRITRLEEPRPSPQAVEGHPWLARWCQHAALFLYVDLRK